MWGGGGAAGIPVVTNSKEDGGGGEHVQRCNRVGWGATGADGRGVGVVVGGVAVWERRGKWMGEGVVVWLGQEWHVRREWLRP